MRNKPLNRLPVFAGLIIVALLALELWFLPSIFTHILEKSQHSYNTAQSPPLGGMAMVFTWIFSMMALGILNLMAVALLGLAALLAVPELVEEKETTYS